MRPRVWGQRAGFQRYSGTVLTLLALLAAAVLFGLLEPRPAPLSGHAAAVDGDTLRLGATRIRLTGLDAPELDQTCTGPDGGAWDCGRQARDFVSRLLDGAETTCSPSGRDTYGRVLARCSADGVDLGSRIVAGGWAVMDFAYLAEEADARAHGRGIWSGQFVPPAEWRRTRGAEPDLWAWIRSWFQ